MLEVDLGRVAAGAHDVAGSRKLTTMERSDRAVSAIMVGSVVVRYVLRRGLRA
jgi:hypothetical protein